MTKCRASIKLSGEPDCAVALAAGADDSPEHTLREPDAENAEDRAGDAAPCGSLPLTQRVEAVLLCSDRPLTDAKIAEVLGLCRTISGEAVDGANRRPAAADPVRQVRDAIEALNAEYAASGRAFRIEAVAGGRQILTIAELGPVTARLKAVRSDGRLSPAALETLAIVAYRQPILRADIESIRGVACGEVLRTLMDRRLIRIVGRAEELGRPMLYGTTREFLRAFGLARIEDLPNPGASGGDPAL